MVSVEPINLRVVYSPGNIDDDDYANDDDDDDDDADANDDKCW